MSKFEYFIMFKITAYIIENIRASLFIIDMFFYIIFYIYKFHRIAAFA